MKRLAYLCLSAALLLGCSKEDILIITSQRLSPLTDFSSRNALKHQTFAFNLGQSTTIRSAGGATLSFPANAFMLPDGRTPATGQAEMRFRELYNVGDMLLADMPTTTYNGQILISGGEFNIQAWQGTTRLRLKGAGPASSNPPAFVLTSPIPASGLDTTPMLLWQLPSRGLAPALDSAGWTMVGGANSIVNATAGHYTVTLPLDSIGWWNIDQFWHAYQNNPTSRVSVTVPAGASETRAYFRPVGFNGLARATATTSAATEYAANLPVGANMIAVVVQVRDNQLYFGTQAITTQANQLVQVPLQALSEEEVVRRIRQL